MRPKTVDAPARLEALFVEAEALVRAQFDQKRERPEEGTIEIAGERYVLLRAASLSVRFFALVRELYGDGRRAEADEFARNILFDLAHGVGRSDAKNFADRSGTTDPLRKLSAGPVHFAFSGWAKVEVADDSNPSPDEDFYFRYDHPYSFESDAWLREGAEADFPVCIMNAGYSSGWCEESFGIRLVATEICCRACGDPQCRFVMAPPERIAAHAERYLEGQAPSVPRATYQVPDLFARKTSEEKLRRARDELELRVAERTRELEQANAALVQEMKRRERVERELVQSQKMEAIGRLSGGIAHDFNNLLGVILGVSSMLESRLPDEEGVGVIRQAAERASELTTQLLAFSRSQILHVEPVELPAVLAESRKLLERSIGADIRIEQTLADAPLVRGSVAGVQQVLLNLALNARDAMPGGGTLSFEVGTRVEGGVRFGLLAVEDTGGGVDPAVADRIFEPFFTSKPGGSGLGLSTAHGIVHQYGGVLRAVGAPGGGARFEVLLPPWEGAPPVPTAPPGPPRDRAVRAGTILLVEDDGALRRVAQEMLERGGHRVISVGSPAEALARVDEGAGHLDLLLTDVVMPGMSGRALADRVIERQPRIPVLYISGYADDDALREGALEPGASFLHKPFTQAQLLAAVRAALAGRTA